MAAPGQEKRTRRRRAHRDGSRSEDFRTDIVNAAARLFGERGYLATTMSDIARAVQIDQSSLYYWFSSKSELLDAVVQMSNAFTDFAGDARARHSAAAFLYALSYRDTLALCSIPVDYFELELAANSEGRRLSERLASYGGLVDFVRGAIVEGCEAGEFETEDVELSTMALLVLDEGVQHRFHQARKGYDPFGVLSARAGGRAGEKNVPADGADHARTARDYAHFAARSALALLSVASSRIDAAQQEADGAGWLET